MGKLKMADNEKTVKLREAEIQMEVGKREEEARAAALIQRAKEEQKVMKERTQQQVEEAKVLLQVAEQQALTAQKEAEGTSLAELVEKQNASRAMLVKAQAEALVLKEKNQTYQYMGEAGITDIVMNKMPEIAGAIAAPLSKTEKMVFISQDDATGSKVTKDIIKTIATLPDAVEGLTGLDLKNAIAKATRL